MWILILVTILSGEIRVGYLDTEAQCEEMRGLVMRQTQGPALAACLHQDAIPSLVELLPGEDV